MSIKSQNVPSFDLHQLHESIYLIQGLLTHFGGEDSLTALETQDNKKKQAQKLFMWTFALEESLPFHYSRNVCSYEFVSMLFTLCNISAKECVCHYFCKGTNSNHKVLLQIFGSELEYIYC